MSSSANPTQALLLKALNGAPPKTCRAEPIDFEALGLPEYKGAFALLIHDLLSADECAALLSAAEATTAGQWDQALVNVGHGEQKLMTDMRLCDRIIWDDARVVDALFGRMRPYIPEPVLALKDAPGITGRGPQRRKETWRAQRLNERLRFLRYTPGMYFREHCDGSYVTPDGQEMSFVTVHLYLNSGQDAGLDGGSTRFYGQGWDGPREHDVNPLAGSCLLFQHRNLWHSGEEVRAGTKYTVRTDLMYRIVEAD